MHVLSFPDFDSFNSTADNWQIDPTLKLHTYWEGLHSDTNCTGLPCHSILANTCSRNFTSTTRKTRTFSSGQNAPSTTWTTNYVEYFTGQTNNGYPNFQTEKTSLLPSQADKIRPVGTKSGHCYNVDMIIWSQMTIFNRLIWCLTNVIQKWQQSWFLCCDLYWTHSLDNQTSIITSCLKYLSLKSLPCLKKYLET